MTRKGNNLQVKLTGSLMAGLKETKESGVKCELPAYFVEYTDITRKFGRVTQMRA